MNKQKITKKLELRALAQAQKAFSRRGLSMLLTGKISHSQFKNKTSAQAEALAQHFAKYEPSFRSQHLFLMAVSDAKSPKTLWDWCVCHAFDGDMELYSYYKENKAEIKRMYTEAAERVAKSI